MKKYFWISMLALIISIGLGCSAQNKEPMVLIRTTMGDIKVKLYNETPQHRDNFLKLAEEGFYDSLLFHRVIRQFMVQAGDPESKGAPMTTMLGSGGPGYTIEAEILPQFFHKKGALAAARTGGPSNPERRSSGSQFYIVQGQVLPTDALDNIEKQMTYNSAGPLVREYIGQPEQDSLRQEIMICQREQNGRALDSIFKVLVDKFQKEGKLKDYKFTPEQREAYSTIGGAPHLDGEYTVFGEVVEGLDIIDKIAATPVGRADRPVQDIMIIETKVLK